MAARALGFSVRTGPRGLVAAWPKADMGVNARIEAVLLRPHSASVRSLQQSKMRNLHAGRSNLEWPGKWRSFLRVRNRPHFAGVCLPVDARAICKLFTRIAGFGRTLRHSALQRDFVCAQHVMIFKCLGPTAVML
jgi:hypothetical protein